MNHFYSRNSLEWSDITIRNQAALNGPMEAVNRRHARFAGSKFKARYATGPHTIVGPGNWTRWRSGKAVSRSVERVGYQWKFSASYIRARFDESEFPRQNREWTRAGKHSRHNCTAGKEPGQTRNGAEMKKSV